MKEENIKILRRVMQTNRACVRYSNIQHFRWKNTTYQLNPRKDKIVLKVYTSGGVIRQDITKEELEKFTKVYFDYVEMVDRR
jgi:hypothetical protein